MFGRDHDFGEKRDSLVRVEVHRLRKKLHRYYETEGADHPVRIVIRAGNYQPDFERVADSPSTSVCEGDATDPLLPEVSPEVRVVETQPVYDGKLVRRYAAGAAVAATLIVAAFASTRYGRNQASESSKIRVPAAIPAAAAAASPQPVRILAGSTSDRSIDRFGNEWRGDRYFIGGYQDALRFGSQERLVSRPIILGAADQTPFRSFRSGDFSYRIPLLAAKYEMRLYFSEVVLGMAESGDGAENKRVFDVHMNSHPLLPFFDIFSDAGAANTADIRVFENVSPASDGFLHLDFHPIREAAWLNAIELIPNESGRALPVRIVMRNDNYTDRKGQLWSMDRYYIGGRGTSDGKLPVGIDDSDLLAGQRYGHFSYRLPVPPGKYKVRLLFAETFFGPDNRGKGGVGSRVFNVYCAGTEVLRQFDIFKEAGENRVIEKVFRGITPSAQGKIDLIFEPVVNYAIVQAIEVTPDDGR